MPKKSPTLLDDLKEKERKVDDIARFVRNRNDDNPNYNLFLGAGCSVSSGISSGMKLISEWRQQIFHELNSDKLASAYTDDEAISYFNSNHSKWYDQRREYASLFEYKYNLPKQRRIFVEQLVSRAKPSIGYAYLVKLIEKSFFRTTFTTNFDDLLNNAFYTFSSECRPMLCAHDSSINSISITSKRPKIIKLHGDYLFDDIKNTVRETESLEENMKNKFMEFSKDHGLIVIGYGGNDRSIMDVLNQLLKREEYFGLGIYWCVRNEQDIVISEELQKLLWKDKVYFVRIDGFDEFMAELSHKLAPNEITPYESRTSIDVADRLKEIEDSEKSFINCRFIVEDLDKSKKEIRKKAYSNQWKAFEFTSEPSGNGSFANCSVEDILQREKIREKIIADDYVGAIEEGQKALASRIVSYDVREDIHLMLFECYQRQNRFSDAIESLLQLEAYNNENFKGNNSAIYRKVAPLIKDIGKRIHFLEEKLKKSPNDSKLFDQLARAHKQQQDKSINSISTDNQIVAILDQSIKHNPSFDNPAYFKKFELLLSGKTSKPDFEGCKQIINTCESQDSYSSIVAEMKGKLILKQEGDLKAFEEYIEQLKRTTPIFSRRFRYDTVLLDVLVEKGSIDKLRTHLQNMDAAYSSDISYCIKKSRILLSKFCSIDSAIKCLMDGLANSMDQQNTDRIRETLADMLLMAGNVEKAEEHINLIKNQEKKAELEEQILLERNQSEKLLSLFVDKQRSSDFYPTLDFYMDYSYKLLRLKNWPKIIEILEPVLHENAYASHICVVNYELAKKMAGDRPKYERLQKIRDGNASEDIKAAATILMSKNKNDAEYKAAEASIKKLIEADYSNFYRFQLFPVFSDIDIASRYKKHPVLYNLEAPDQSVATVSAQFPATANQR